jgi:hypothetical protein
MILVQIDTSLTHFGAKTVFLETGKCKSADVLGPGFDIDFPP